MNDIAVREASLSELPRIAHLKKQIHDLHVAGRPDLFAHITEPEVFMQHAAQQEMRLLLAECCGDPVGYALIRIVDRPANPYMQERRFLHVEEFCVEESHRREGIGRALMESVRQAARAAQLFRIELDVWAFNEGAKAFYESAGLRTYRYFMEMEV